MTKLVLLTVKLNKYIVQLNKDFVVTQLVTEIWCVKIGTLILNPVITCKCLVNGCFQDGFEAVIPAYARIITRGAVTDLRTDISSLELFAVSSVL